MKWALAFATARVFDKKHGFLEVLYKKYPLASRMDTPK